MMTQAMATPAVQLAERLRFCSLKREDSGRLELEGLIRDRYQSVHTARTCHFLDHLLTLQRAGQVRAAIGVARAREGLFLESYLGAPIEEILAAKTDGPLVRQGIVEIGSLVSFEPAAATLLMILSVIWIAGFGAQWGAFTATRAVRERLFELGLPLHELAPAAPCRLGPAARHWGTYFENDPRVVAVGFDEARSLIEKLPHRFADLGVDAFEDGHRRCAEEARA